MLLQILFYTHHLTTLLFGVFLSAFFLGVNRDRKNIGILLLSALASGLLYLISIFLIGTAFSDEIYPFVVHLPLFLILVFYYKFRWLQSLTSILTAYLCCQYSNWAGIFVLTLTHQEWCYYLCRILVTLIVFFLLCRYLCPTTALLFEKSDRELSIICSMPFVYYLFDYATTKFSTLLYSGSKVVSEFMGFALCLAYLLFLLIYFREYELKSRTEQYNELINMQLRSLRSEIEQAKKSEHNMSILRHDMRHHLMILQTYVQNQETDKALDYIQQIHQTYENTIISTFSQNELLNSILSIYSSRLQELGIAFHAQVAAPKDLPCSEMIFCAILSNILENAMNAVKDLSQENRRIELHIFEKMNHLMLLEKNPAPVPPVFSDGIPVTRRSGHGLGVKSIIYYVESQQGQYQFFMEGTDFAVRIIL